MALNAALETAEAEHVAAAEEEEDGGPILTFPEQQTKAVEEETREEGQQASVITSFEMSHCMPDTNELSSIIPSAHHPALFLIQSGIEVSV